ncbi:MAG: DUF4215 domain-containing protein [bacterium]
MILSKYRLLGAVLMSGCLLVWASCGDDDGGNGVCGDGVLDTGEQCDDGNTVSGDGCSATCQNEGTQECGNGDLEGTEECDDGNTTDGDGCSSTCMNEGAGVIVSGTAGRVSGTCPDAYGSIGTLCVSIRTTCNDIGTEVASTSVANADMSAPIDMPYTPVSWSIADVPAGSYSIYAFLDMSNGDCGDPLGTGDLTEGGLCIDVTVAAVDVTDVDFEFNSIAP